MRKILIIIFAAICMGPIFSCNKENDPGVENATTRGTNANDSTENGCITLNTEWEDSVEMGF